MLVVVSDMDRTYELPSQFCTEPTLATEFVKKLFACQHNEKVRGYVRIFELGGHVFAQSSIQDCVASLAETCTRIAVYRLTQLKLT